MWISLSWLRDYVDLGDRSPERIAEDLTMRTALIEGFETRGELPDDVVVGRVLERVDHRDSDRLSVCQVDAGGDPVQVVCGAPNVAAGQAVVVARVGATLPGGVKIAASEIRGVTSHGMICSETELGVGDATDGILVLGDDIEAGRPFRDLAGVCDVLLDIDNKSITHRPDLWGHVGFARELAAIYRVDLREPAIDESLRAGAGPVEVRIEAPDLCGRYYALFVTGPLGGPSPGWMQRRLTYCGQRPLSLAVDVSNYMMLELGQPTHPFDRRTIRGDRIVIRRATPGERLVTLDGDERTLPVDSCVIADAERAVAVAGVIGGEETGIQPDTSDLVLECAWFDPISVRRTSTALGMRTEALARFEKFLDPALPEKGVRRFAALLGEIDPGLAIADEFVVAGDKAAADVAFTVRPDRVRAKLGVELEESDMTDVLARLGFGVEPGEGALEVSVPTFRATRDVLIEDDVIEEIGRIHGYDRIPSIDARFLCAPVTLEPTRAAVRDAQRLLSGRAGFAEVASYPFVEEPILSRAGTLEDGPYVELKNPLQKSARRLRRSLVPWMLEFVDRNQKAVEEVRLFECGRVFLLGDGYGELPEQPDVLTAALGTRTVKKGESGQALRRLKGVLEAVAAEVRRDVTFATPTGEPPAWAHPGRCARVDGASGAVGWLAEVHPRVADSFGWLGETAIFEVDLSSLVRNSELEHEYRAPARFPGVVRDISFRAPFTLQYEAVVSGLQSSTSLLDRVELVDEYTAGSDESGERSLTLRLRFRSDERTLTDEEVGAELDRAQGWLRSAGASQRG